MSRSLIKEKKNRVNVRNDILATHSHTRTCVNCVYAVLSYARTHTDRDSCSPFAWTDSLLFLSKSENRKRNTRFDRYLEIDHRALCGADSFRDIECEQRSSAKTRDRRRVLSAVLTHRRPALLCEYFYFVSRPFANRLLPLSTFTVLCQQSSCL